ncbi:MAG TPA: lmo0937 family membrane protein [Flavobacterium sp.]|uniref:lmo0937 family membrane protein n=1 Tax=Flavobacterium sp. TaxID=239 RepID=UPI002B5E6426|nr:lmo0937 family membrane protein [Flavobacterium sp.]HNP32941.1 lmo0937 family membrane protein [Flavobacterium sp.]
MQNLLYTVAVVLLILWALGFFVFNIGSVIHILLLIVVIALLLNIIKGKEV